jgi:hypothetical protein
VQDKKISEVNAETAAKNPSAIKRGVELAIKNFMTVNASRRFYGNFLTAWKAESFSPPA